MYRNGAWLILSVAACAAGAGPADAFLVAERGRAPTCGLVVEAEGPSFAYAANEFSKYVEKMTGVVLPRAASTRTVVLRRKGAGVSGDAFSLKVEGDRLVISGGERGVIYGVYEVLERFGGCGFFSSWCEEIPSLERFELPRGIDELHKPAIPLRESGWMDCMWRPQFLVKCRVNVRSWRPPVPEHGGVAFRFGARWGFCHTFGKLLPVEEYFDAHPEYYSEVNDKRLRDATQLCLSNPDVLKIVTEKVLGIFRREPEADAVSVSQDDWFNYCTCEKCRAVDEAEGGPSGSMIRFVNAVAEAVDREFPGKIVETIAYQYTRRAPKMTKPRANVMVMYCPMEIDVARPIYEGTDKQTVACREEIDEWFKVTDRMFIATYDTNFTDTLSPFPNVEPLLKNLKYYADRGVYSVYAMAMNNGWHAEFAELKNYLVTRWMWNPNRDMNAEIDRFMKGYYGAAAPIVRKYYDALVYHQMKKGNPRFSVYESIGRVAEIYPPHFFIAAARHFREAEALVRNDPVRLYNVKTTGLSVDYVLYSLNYHDVFFSPGDRRGDDVGRQAHARLVETFELAQASDDRYVAMCDGLQRSNGKRQAIIDAFKNGKVVVGDGSSVVLEESDFGYTGYSSMHTLVDDPKAHDGRAVKIGNEHYGWQSFFNLSRVAFRPGKKYRLSIRCRADLTGVDAPVLEPNIYDFGAKKYPAKVNLFGNRQIGAEYAWVEAFVFEPGPAQQLNFSIGWWDKKRWARNPAFTSIHIDCIRIEEME